MGVKYLSLKKPKVRFFSVPSIASLVADLVYLTRTMFAHWDNINMKFKSEPGICLQKNCYLKPSCAEGRKVGSESREQYPLEA